MPTISHVGVVTYNNFPFNWQKWQKLSSKQESWHHRRIERRMTRSKLVTLFPQMCWPFLKTLKHWNQWLHRNRKWGCSIFFGKKLILDSYCLSRPRHYFASKLQSQKETWICFPIDSRSYTGFTKRRGRWILDIVQGYHPKNQAYFFTENI